MSFWSTGSECLCCHGGPEQGEAEQSRLNDLPRVTHFAGQREVARVAEQVRGCENDPTVCNQLHQRLSGYTNHHDNYIIRPFAEN